MNIRHTKAILMATACLLPLATGCVTPGEPAQTYPDDKAWKAFTQTARSLEWRDWDKGRAYVNACLALGLTNYRIRGPVFIAQKERSEIRRKPIPKIGEAHEQVLVAAGDVAGDETPEYVLGAGWSDPAGGVMAVYDQDLRKMAELNIECVWGIELKDLTNDGRCEILCWEDQHQGRGLWQRRLSILRYVEGKGLAVIWKGSTYDQVGDFLETHRIAIDQPRGGSAVIVQTLLRKEWPQRVGNEWLVRTSEPRSSASYVWDKAQARFVKQSDILKAAPAK